MAVPVTTSSVAPRAAIEDIELALLFEGLYRARGDDFRAYEPTALKVRLHAFMIEHQLSTLSALQDLVLHHPVFGDALVRMLYARPTAMFEHTAYQIALRSVARELRSWPAPNVWLPECSSAEEVFSTAILLEEEGVYGKTRIFVTHANQDVVSATMSAGFPANHMPAYAENYRRAGGKAELIAYCEPHGDAFMISPSLRQNIVWAQSDLASDASFNEFQLVLCRRAMKDFGQALRRRSLHVFDESLSAFGILSLDSESEAELRMVTGRYKPIEPSLGLYRRLG
jgi:chemotaxis protein methyltransferase CheR